MVFIVYILSTPITTPIRLQHLSFWCLFLMVTLLKYKVGKYIAGYRLNHRPKYEWYAVWCGSKNEYMYMLKI